MAGGGRSGRGKPARGRKRVVVIDDDPAVAEVLNEFFKQDYDVEVSLNGADGIMAVQVERPDLVILDVNMPGINGLEVLKRIREHDPTIQVIMLTANTDLRIAEEVLKSGAFAYFPKPVNLQYLAHLVASI
jgi:two-component system response regulator (stage 0 sporulation protein F)